MPPRAKKVTVAKPIEAETVVERKVKDHELPYDLRSDYDPDRVAFLTDFMRSQKAVIYTAESKGHNRKNVLADYHAVGEKLYDVAFKYNNFSDEVRKKFTNPNVTVDVGNESVADTNASIRSLINFGRVNKAVSVNTSASNRKMVNVEALPLFGSDKYNEDVTALLKAELEEEKKRKGTV